VEKISKIEVKKETDEKEFYGYKDNVEQISIAPVLIK
jgi:hypothetical protein